MSVTSAQAFRLRDILAVVYGDLLRAESPDEPDRDRFVLSKGHAALALYAALNLRGWLDAELDTFCADGTLLGCIRSISCRGRFRYRLARHGLVFAAGAALAARLQPRRVGRMRC